MLEVKDICKKYGDKQVLHGVSFEVKSGEICGLLGLNGAGKSTLMKIICSLVFENAGTVTLNGVDLKTQRNSKGGKKETVGFMIEAPAFYSGLTGKQNLSALAQLYSGIDEVRIDEVLKQTGMSSHANTVVRKYSMGMKQRLYFAYALLAKPKIFILDEPFNGVDPVTVKLFRDQIIALSQQGCTVLISSHMIADIKTFCTKAVIIDQGVVKYNGAITPDMDVESMFISLVGQSGAAQ